MYCIHPEILTVMLNNVVSLVLNNICHAKIIRNMKQIVQCPD